MRKSLRVSQWSPHVSVEAYQCKQPPAQIFRWYLEHLRLCGHVVPERDDQYQRYSTWIYSVKFETAYPPAGTLCTHYFIWDENTGTYVCIAGATKYLAA